MLKNLKIPTSVNELKNTIEIVNNIIIECGSLDRELAGEILTFSEQFENSFCVFFIYRLIVMNSLDYFVLSSQWDNWSYKYRHDILDNNCIGKFYKDNSQYF